MSQHHAKLDRKRWARARALVIERAGFRCEKCGAARRFEVDHIRPLHEDPDQDPYDLAGLQCLCSECHRDKSADEAGLDPQRRAWRALVADLTGGA